MNTIGNRYRYVGFPKNHIYIDFNCYTYETYENDVIQSTPHEMKIKYAINNIDVHEKLTFASNSIISINYSNWYFGFDYAHSYDRKDFKITYEYFKNDDQITSKLKAIEQIKTEFKDNNQKIRTFNYVKDEVYKLYSQLKSINSNNQTNNYSSLVQIMPPKIKWKYIKFNLSFAIKINV